MSRPALLLPSLLCALAGFTGQAQAASVTPTPLMLPCEFGVTVSDGQRLIDRWRASIYYQVWQDPASERVRAEFTKKLDAATADLGFDPLAALAALRGGALRGRIDVSGPVPKPTILGQADLGEFAAKLMAKPMARVGAGGMAAATVAGAAEAIQDQEEGVLLARFGQVLVGSMNLPQAELVPGKPPSSTADIDVRFTWGSFGDNITQLASAFPGLDIQDDGFLGAVLHLARTNDLGDQGYQLSIVPEGVLERFTWTTVLSGAKPVDRALLARLPANALVTLGIGLDGKSYWKANRAAILGMTPDEHEAQLNQRLAEMGLTCTLTQLVEGLTGTALFAVTPSVPLPTVTVALPRSPALDQVIGLLLGRLQTPVPAEGTTTLVTIPNVPVSMEVGMDQTTWLITSDTLLAATFLTGKPGGWADSPTGSFVLGKATADAFVIGGSDTDNVLRRVAQFIGFLMARDQHSPEVTKTVLQSLNKFASLAAPGYIVGGTMGGHTVIEDRGLLGVMPGITCMSAVVRAVSIWKQRGLLKPQVEPRSAGPQTDPVGP